MPSASFVGVTQLPQHILKWHKRSKDGSGKCDVVFTGKDSDYVFGAIYEIPDEDEPALDRMEGLGAGYRKKSKIFDLPFGRVMANYYQATAGAIDAGLSPFTWYKEHVLCGALDHGLPAHYVETLSRVPSRLDPDTAREQREQSIRGARLGAHGVPAKSRPEAPR